MGNKIIYEDFAIGASTYAYVDLSSSDHQMQTVVDGNETVTVDPYHVEYIFQDQPNDYIAVDSDGFDVRESFNVFGEGTVSGGEVTGGDNYGFVSDRISNYDKTFTSNPKLVIKFTNDKTFSGSGIGITFSRYYCTKVKVRYQLIDDSYTDYEQYTISSLYAFLPKTVQGYKAVEIEFVETEKSYQYVTIKKVEFGHNVIITKFRSISFNKKIDFYCSDVPINTMDATFVYDEELTFYNNQKIRLYHNEELIGTYWVAEAEMQTDKIYSITAEDSFAKAEYNIRYALVLPDYMDDVTIEPLLDFYARDIGVQIESNEAINEAKQALINGYFKDGTYRKFLAELAFNMQLFPTVKENGDVRFKQPSDDVVYEISKDRIIDVSTFKKEDATSSVTATFSQYKRLSNNPDTEIYRGKIGTDAISVKSDLAIFAAYVYYDGATTDHYEWQWAVRDTVLSHSENEFVTRSERRYRIKSAYSSESDRTVSIIAINYVPLTFFASSSVVLPSGDVYAKDFGEKPFFTEDYQDKLDELVGRTSSVKGSVKAKVVLNYDVVENEGTEDESTVTKYLDVGDYVSIETKYSGTKKGTITEIDADVGERDIVGNVVITVWD